MFGSKRRAADAQLHRRIADATIIGRFTITCTPEILSYVTSGSLRELPHGSPHVDIPADMIHNRPDGFVELAVPGTTLALILAQLAAINSERRDLVSGSMTTSIGATRMVSIYTRPERIICGVLYQLIGMSLDHGTPAMIDREIKVDATQIVNTPA